MQFHLDRIIAGVVGLAVITILIGLLFRMQEKTVENTNLYTANSQTLNFGEVLERDLGNAGFGIGPGDQGILAFNNVVHGSVTITDTLIFRGVGNGGGSALVRYLTLPVDSALVEGQKLPTYRVSRQEDLGAGWIESGASPSSLIDFRIELLDLANNVSTPLNARKLRVRMVNAVPVNVGNQGENRTMEQVHWGITLTPSGLALGDFQGG